MATLTLTRGKTLPDSGVKKDLHDLIDLATGTISGIVNADVHNSAAIAGSKIAPNFGSQTVVCGDCNVTDEFQLNGSAGTAGQVVTSAGSGSDTVWSTLKTPWTYDGTTVLYDDTTAEGIDTWVSKDISGTVGAKRVKILVKIRTAEAKNLYVTLRTLGETDVPAETDRNPSYCATEAIIGSFCLIEIITNSSGVFEWIQNHATCSMDMILMAYCEVA